MLHAKLKIASAITSKQSPVAMKYEKQNECICNGNNASEWKTIKPEKLKYKYLSIA